MPTAHFRFHDTLNFFLPRAHKERLIEHIYEGRSSVKDMIESLGILRSYGNMSSPTVGFILDRLRQSGPTPPCVVLGFGPGVSIEAALLV